MSSQLRRENVTPEREVHIEKDRVPKITSHFESLTVQESGDVTHTPTDSSSKDSHDDKERKGNNTIEGMGTEKARETRELRSHNLESTLAGQMKEEKQRDREREMTADTANMVADKEAEAKRGRETGARGVGKFEVQESDGGQKNKGGREEMITVSEGREDARVRQGVESRKMDIMGRESKGGAHGVGKVEVVRFGGEAKGREGQGQAMVQQRGTDAEMMRVKEECRSREQRQGTEMEGNENKRQQPSLEQVSAFRQQAQQNSMETLRAAEERYQQAKETANQSTLASTTAKAKETALKAEEAASQTLGPAAQKAKETASTATQKAKEISSQTVSTTTEKGAQVRDISLEKSQQGLYAAKDTLSSAGRKTAEYTEKTKDMAISAGNTTLHYAGDVAVDLKDKATVAGWTAAHYTTEAAVEGTKAAARVVAGAAGYAGHKAVDIVSKPLSLAKDAAAVTGEKAEEFTARKKQEEQREYEAKRAAEENRPKGESEVERASRHMQREGGKASQGTSQSQSGVAQEGDTGVVGKIDGSLGAIPGAVSETIERASQYMQREGGRPTEKSSQEASQSQMDVGQEGGTGVLGSIGGTLGVIPGAVGETLVEIAENTRNLVVGQGESGMSMEGEQGWRSNAQEWGSDEKQGREEGRSFGKQSETLSVISGAVGETLVEVARTTKGNIIGQRQSAEESAEEDRRSSDQQKGLGAIPRAVGETMVEIAETTKDNVDNITGLRQTGTRTGTN